MIPQHLGALHPVEQVATIVLAFGPFVVLGIVIAIRRRAELAQERLEAEQSSPVQDAADDTTARLPEGEPGREV